MPRASWSGFSAPVSGVLPGLSLAGDDAHKILSLAPGVATSCGRRARPGGAGSRATRAACLWIRIKTAAGGSASHRASGSRHPHRAASTRPEGGRGDCKIGRRQRIRIRPRPVRYVYRRGAEGARCREIWRASCRVATSTPSISTVRITFTPMVRSRWKRCG